MPEEKQPGEAGYEKQRADEYEEFLARRRAEWDKKHRSLGMIWDDFAQDHPLIAWPLALLFILIFIGGGAGFLMVTIFRLLGLSGD